MTTIVLAEKRDLHRHELRTAIEVEQDLYVVDEARDGWEAWDKTEKQKPDLLIVNSNLPGLSNREIAQRVLDMPSPPYMVIIREDDNVSYVCESVDGGVMGFGMKSSDNAEFAHNIQQIFRGRFVPRSASFWSHSASNSKSLTTIK